MPRIVVNKNHDDLHVNDYLNRLRLRRQFQKIQHELGLSDTELSERSGYGHSWAKNIFGRTSWRVTTVQQMARALGYRLEFDVAIKLPGGIGVNITETSALYDDPAQQEQATRIDLTQLGKKLREILGIPVKQLAASLTMEPTKVAQWERGDRPEYFLVTAQRYFRALGGELRFLLVDADGNVSEPEADAELDQAVEASWLPKHEEVVVHDTGVRVVVYNSLHPATVVSFPSTVWREMLMGSVQDFRRVGE